jgi:hypothetical protein
MISTNQAFNYIKGAVGLGIGGALSLYGSRRSRGK